MSEEREVTHVKTFGELKQEEAKPISEMSRTEIKARFAKVLERGIINARLDVDLPAGVHGEWVRNDEVDVSRMQALGFEIDKIYAKESRLHSDGSDTSIVGDVIFMTCSQDIHQIILEIKRERFNEMHGTKKGADQLEEADYKASVAARTPEVPIIEESRARQVQKEEIASVLEQKQRGG